MDQKKVKLIVKAYLSELRKKVEPEKVILFGSYAKKRATEDSDIDLVILSKDFTRLSIDERFKILYHARKHPLTRKCSMDIFGYTPEEFAQASPLTTLGEAKETGLTIFPK